MIESMIKPIHTEGYEFLPIDRKYKNISNFNRPEKINSFPAQHPIK